jgi:Uma2 family endonuclease
MNEHVSPKTFQVATPRPVEPERRRFTGAELEAMDRAGIIGPEERVELIDGEIIAMAAKGNRHEIVRSRLMNFWARRLPADLSFADEPAFKLEPHNEPEPDIIIFPDALQVPDVRGDSVLLVVEVSDSSLSRDLKIKAPLYARFGVREYWVVDSLTHETHIHRGPSAGGYASVTMAARSDLLTPLLVPSLAVRLSDLRLE